MSWETIYRVVHWESWVFPAPSHILSALLDLASPSAHFALFSSLSVSVLRVCMGFSISVFFGGLLGIAMWRFPPIDGMLGGLFLGLQTLPSVCWVPIATLTLGLTEGAILFVVVMGSFFAVAIALRDGVRAIPPIYLRAGRMLGARGYELYRYVLLPASLPALATSLRHGFAFAWRSLLGAELIFMLRGHGLGYLLHQGREFSDVAQVMAVMWVMILVGMMADRWGFAIIEERVHERFGLGMSRA